MLRNYMTIALRNLIPLPVVNKPIIQLNFWANCLKGTPKLW